MLLSFVTLRYRFVMFQSAFTFDTACHRLFGYHIGIMLLRGSYVVVSFITLSFPGTCYAVPNTNLYLNSNILKTVSANIVFTNHVFQRVFNKISDDMQVDRLCTCGYLVIDV